MTKIRLNNIAFDAGTQIRAAIDQHVVTDYAEAMAAGATFPPIVLFHDGTQHYLADGFHRFLAAQRNEWREFAADVRPGTKDDALWFALGANRVNGHRLSTADKRHAIALAIQAWPERSGAQIAEQVGCSPQYVTTIKSGMTTTFDRIVTKTGQVRMASTSAAEKAKEDAAVLLRQGLSVEAVAKQLRIGRDRVHEIRRALGLGVDKSGEAVRTRHERMRQMAATGHTSRQIAATLQLSEQGCRATMRGLSIDVPADRAVGHIKRHDANRILERIVMDAENLTEGVNLVDFATVDYERVGEWVDSLVQSRKSLDAFIKRLVKEREKHGEAA